MQKKQAENRLEFLDFARGVAAVSVALGHTFSLWSPRFYKFVLNKFNPGVFGVMTFFLVSGFVIPFSLERLGSLKKFWINRFFRLYPLYWLSLFGVLFFYRLGVGAPPNDFLDALPWSAVWNVTMVHVLFNVPTAIGLYWTLSYEMVFYVAMSALFLFGWHKKTAWLIFGGTVIYFVADVIQPLARHQLQFHIPQFWMMTFCVGTGVYRAWSGDERPATIRWAVLALGVTMTLASIVNFLYIGLPPDNPHANENPQAFLTGWVFAYAFFGLLIAFPKLRFPRVTLWLGRISYSIYIVHGLILQIMLPLPPTALLAFRLVGTLVVSALTYRFVEQPFLQLGKRLNGRRSEVVVTSQACIR